MGLKDLVQGEGVVMGIYKGHNAVEIVTLNPDPNPNPEHLTLDGE